MSRLAQSFFDAPVAHRGLHDRKEGIIENSLSAVKAAIAGGYGIEIDLQPAQDLSPMVFHDYTLHRLTGMAGTTKSRTVHELQSLTLVDSSEGVPTLETVLAEVNGRVPMLIEIKDQDMRLGPNVGDFTARVCDVLSAYDGDAALMSFNPYEIAVAKERLPDQPIGLVTDPFLEQDWPNVPQDRRVELARIPDAIELGIDFISHQQTDLESAHVARMKKLGLSVFCWTIRSQDDAERALTIADNITFEGYAAARQS